MARNLIDANLPRHIGVWASGDYAFVADLDATLQDIEIWDYAATHGLTIVSKDADFANLVLFREIGPAVIHVKAGNLKFRELDAFLSRTWNDICNLSEQYRLIQVFVDRIEAVS